MKKKIIVPLLLLASIIFVLSYNNSVASAQTLNPTIAPTSTPTPNFGMCVSPTYIALLPQTTQTANVKLYSIAGYSGTIGLSAISTTSQITANLAATSLSVKPGQSAATTLSISVPSTVPSGQYNVIVIGKTADGSLTHSISITLQVIRPDFGVSASASYYQIVAGKTITSTIKVWPIQRFNGTIGLSATSDPEVTSNIASPSISIKYNQSSTTSITVTVPSNTLAGKYKVAITGQTADASIVHSATISIQVIKPDFSIGASPSWLSIVSGQSGTSLIRLSSLSKYNGTVTLTAQAPTGWTNPSFTYSSLKLAYNTNANTSLTISVPPATKSGPYPLTVTGTTADGITHSVTVTIQVLNPDFNIYDSPSWLSIVSGTQATTTVHLYQTNRFNGTVALAATAPGGWNTPTLSQPQLWIDYAHSNSEPLTISVPAGTPSGPYTIAVAASSGLLSHSATINVQVLNPDFKIYSAPANMYLVAGTTGTAIIHISPINRFNGTIILTAQEPSGWSTSTFMPSEVSIDYAHGNTAVLSIPVPEGTFDGKYVLTVTATSGQLTHQTTITVQVITPNIALQASPSLVTIPAGSTGTINIGVLALGRYNGTVTISATTPDNWQTTLTNPPLPVAYNHASAYTKMQIGIPTETAPGKYTIQITGTGDQLSLTDTITATIIVK